MNTHSTNNDCFLNIWSHLTIPSTVTDPRTHRRGILICPSNESYAVLGSDLLYCSNYFGVLSSCLGSGSADLEGEDWSSTDALDSVCFLNCTKIMVMLSHPSPPAVDGAKHLSSTLSHTVESLLSCIIYNNFYCQNLKGCNVRPL